MSAQQPTLDDQWALITGAGKRIGACIACKLHQAGAGIAIHYNSSAEPAEELANRLNSIRANSAVTIQADLRDTQSLNTVLTSIVERIGRLDILVNNASSFYPTPLDSITEQQWEDLIGTNLKAPLFLSQAAEPYLRDSGGVIINIVDIHANRPLRNHALYGVAKAGLAMLTRTLARDLAPAIRVNGVSPGAILWPEDEMPDHVKDNIIGQVPMKRAGEADDIANCVLYLVRDAAYVTGQIIAVDGGRSIGW